jgi:hypothetical protein
VIPLIQAIYGNGLTPESPLFDGDPYKNNPNVVPTLDPNHNSSDEKESTGKGRSYEPQPNDPRTNEPQPNESQPNELLPEFDVDPLMQWLLYGNGIVSESPSLFDGDPYTNVPMLDPNFGSSPPPLGDMDYQIFEVANDYPSGPQQYPTQPDVSASAPQHDLTNYLSCAPNVAIELKRKDDEIAALKRELNDFRKHNEQLQNELACIRIMQDSEQEERNGDSQRQISKGCSPDLSISPPPMKLQDYETGMAMGPGTRRRQSSSNSIKTSGRSTYSSGTLPESFGSSFASPILENDEDSYINGRFKHDRSNSDKFPEECG